jgi:hypothetical protein
LSDALGQIDLLDSSLAQTRSRRAKFAQIFAFDLKATRDGKQENANGEPNDLLYTLGTALEGILSREIPWTFAVF